MHCAPTTLHVAQTRRIPYPDPAHYAESFDVYEGHVYAPLMRGFLGALKHCCRRGKPSGLYRRPLDQLDGDWELVFPFAKAITRGAKPPCILGSKVRHGRFVGTDTKNNALLVVDLATGDHKFVPLGVAHGCPNDVCFDTEDNGIVYVVSNLNARAENGLLLKVDLATGLTQLNGLTAENQAHASSMVQPIFGKPSSYDTTHPALGTCTGVAVRNNTIFVATLTDIITVDKRNSRIHSCPVVGEKTGDWPFFDNITHGQHNSLLVSVYAYRQRLGYGVIRNRTAMQICMSLLFRNAGYLDQHNVDQLTPMSKSKIRFARIHSSFYEYVTLDAVVPHYDCEITQINQLSATDYLCVNYKANGLLWMQAA